MRIWFAITLLFLSVTPSYAQEIRPPLQELAAAHDLWIGSAVNTGAFRGDARFLRLLERELSIVTPENIFKFEELSPEPGVYNWRHTDPFVDWAEEHKMRVHGHVLVWHNAMPEWLDESRFTPAELEALLENHIKTVVGRYKGRIHEWDVVNEAVAENGRLRDTIWLRMLGPEYIAKAFRWAHEADPDALLFYNDFGADIPNGKANAIYELVKGLVQDGVPIHGVGLQMHVSHSQRYLLTTEAVRAVMDRLGDLGLQVAITEMDVRINSAASTLQESYEIQAGIYANVLRACVEAPNCHTFITWGISDRYSWITGHTGLEDWPLPFDENLNPKPAYFAIVDVLTGKEPLETG